MEKAWCTEFAREEGRDDVREIIFEIDLPPYTTALLLQSSLSVGVTLSGGINASKFHH
jgi:hypothetical protein